MPVSFLKGCGNQSIGSRFFPPNGGLRDFHDRFHDHDEQGYAGYDIERIVHQAPNGQINEQTEGEKNPDDNAQSPQFFQFVHVGNGSYQL